MTRCGTCGGEIGAQALVCPVKGAHTRWWNVLFKSSTTIMPGSPVYEVLFVRTDYASFSVRKCTLCSETWVHRIDYVDTGW